MAEPSALFATHPFWLTHKDIQLREFEMFILTHWHCCRQPRMPVGHYNQDTHTLFSKTQTNMLKKKRNGRRGKNFLCQVHPVYNIMRKSFYYPFENDVHFYTLNMLCNYYFFSIYGVALNCHRVWEFFIQKYIEFETKMAVVCFVIPWNHYICELLPNCYRYLQFKEENITNSIMLKMLYNINENKTESWCFLKISL